MIVVMTIAPNYDCIVSPKAVLIRDVVYFCD
jgi:hypothetical protein